MLQNAAREIDWIGAPLCNLCQDWHLGDGQFEAERMAVEARGGTWFKGPYEPTEITRATQRLLQFFVVNHRMDAVTARLVAEFLRPWHAP